MFTRVIYSRTSSGRTSLGPWKFVSDMGISSHEGIIIAPGQEANGDYLGCRLSRGVFSIFYKIMVCWVYSLESPRWGNSVRKRHMRQNGHMRPAKEACAFTQFNRIFQFTERILDWQGCKVFSCRQRRLWSDCADAQSDLSLRCTHMSEVTFLTLRLIYCVLIICDKPSYLVWQRVAQKASVGISLWCTSSVLITVLHVAYTLLY